MHEMLHWSAGARAADRPRQREPRRRRAVEHLRRPERQPVAARHRLDPVLLREQPGSARHDHPGVQGRRARACCRRWSASTRSSSRTRASRSRFPTQDEVDAYLPPFAPRYILSPDEPHAFGGLPAGDGYMELRARIEASMRRAETVAQRRRRGVRRQFGRRHPIVEEYRTDDADVVLVASGTVAGTARGVVDAAARGGPEGRPAEDSPVPPVSRSTPIRRALAFAQKIAVVDRNISFGHGGIMASEIRAALCSRPVPPPLFSFIAGLGGRDITPETLDEVVAHTTGARGAGGRHAVGRAQGVEAHAARQLRRSVR